MSRYNYEPLDKAAKEIRIITLLPGQFSDPIRITLRKSRLTKDHQEPYEALSYVWGSTEHLTDITVYSGQTIAVTQNLAEALPYLRYEDEPRYLWIDAICINQMDLLERGHQVKQMADIYKSARRVVAWLGPASSDSDLAIMALETLSEEIEVNWIESTMRVAGKPLSDLFAAHKRASLPPKENLVTILGNLFNRPWFERLWIWQEIRLANDDATLLCGTYYFPWRQFRKAILNLISRDLIGRPPKHVIILCLPHVLTRLEGSIYFTQDCKCSDPRDRIFAILGILGAEDQLLDIIPDYESPVEKVYEQVVLKMIEKQDRLDMIAACDLRDRQLVLPSWVPDWSTKRLTDPLPYHDHHTTPSRAKFIGNNVLEVKVKVSTKIVSSEIIENRSQSVQDDVRAFKKVVPRNADERAYIGGGTLFEAYFRTLCFNLLEYHYRRSYLSYVMGEHFSYIKSQLKALLEADSFDPDILVVSTLSYLLMLRDTCKERSLFQTEEGIIGMGPSSLKAGDEICAVFGSDQTMILRPVENGNHIVIGECYMHGISHLEILLGPLPEHYSYDASYEVRQAVFAGRYINHDTGDVEVEHPLLGEVPKGWTVVPSSDGVSRSRFLHEETGVETSFDPRLYPEVLLERGVDVKTFQLI